MVDRAHHSGQLWCASLSHIIGLNQWEVLSEIQNKGGVRYGKASAVMFGFVNVLKRAANAVRSLAALLSTLHKQYMKGVIIVVQMTRGYDGGYVVLGCELLSEFRRNGSIDSIQQKLVNKNGLTLLSCYNYSGEIKPDAVYAVYFYNCDEDGIFIPVFWIWECTYIPYKVFVSDPFPNAGEDLRREYQKVESSGGRFIRKYCIGKPVEGSLWYVYDGCKR